MAKNKTPEEQVEFRKYGKRECPVCQAMFLPTYAAQICCSDECKTKREKEYYAEYKREYSRKQYEILKTVRHKMHLFKELEERDQQQKDEILALKQENEKLDEKITALTAELESIEVVHDANADLKAENAKLKTDIMASMKSHNEITAECSRLRDENERLAAENTQLLEEIGRIMEEAGDIMETEDCKRCGKAKAMPGKSLCTACSQALSA